MTGYIDPEDVNPNDPFDELDRGPCHCCRCNCIRFQPKMYPWWACPPFCILKPFNTLRNLTLVFANLCFVGLCVYYFILLPETEYHEDAVTDSLWTLGVVVICLTIWNLFYVLRLIRASKKLAKRVQRGLDIKRELTETINKLGEGEKKTVKRLVELHKKIKATRTTRRRLAQRNTQGYREVTHIEEIFDKVIVKHENFEASRAKLLDQMTDHMGHLNDVDREVAFLRDHSDGIRNRAVGLHQTLNDLQSTVFALTQVLSDMEGDMSNMAISNHDANEDDMSLLVEQLRLDRQRFQQLTSVMESSMARSIVLETLRNAGESGIDRDHWEAIIERLPAGARRAHNELGGQGDFDSLRQESTRKVMDTKVGRRKRPGVNQDGAENYIRMLADKIQNLSTKPMPLSQLKPQEPPRRN